MTGTGKTVAVQSLLNSLRPMPYDGGTGIIPIFTNIRRRSSRGDSDDHREEALNTALCALTEKVIFSEPYTEDPFNHHTPRILTHKLARRLWCTAICTLAR